jgi:hypothetical protein
MINRPPFFDRWAASIRHQPIDERTSSITYAWSFAGRPRVLRWLLEPIIVRVFHRETRKRLRALRDYFDRGRSG